VLSGGLNYRQNHDQAVNAVTGSGRFKLRLSIAGRDGKATEDVTTFAGSFSKKRGTITYGWAQHYMAGCTAKFVLRKLWRHKIDFNRAVHGVSPLNDWRQSDHYICSVCGNYRGVHLRACLA
jgi:hypothetical protein